MRYNRTRRSSMSYYETESSTSRGQYGGLQVSGLVTRVLSPDIELYIMII